MADFSISTQKNSWQINPSEIAAEKHAALKEQSGRPSFELGTLVKEEEIVIRHYCIQILIVFGILPNKVSEGSSPSTSAGNTIILNRTWRVPVTSLVYFRRFYLRNSIVRFDPRIIMLASIFLAGKVEDSFVTMESLQRIMPNCDNEILLKHEILLLESLRFDLRVYHPNNILKTLIKDWNYYADRDHPDETRQIFATEVRQECDLLLFLLLTTNASLCHTPASLMAHALIATVHQSSHPTFANSLEEYLETKVGLKEWSSIKCEMASIFKYIQDATSPLDDKKLLSCLNRLKKIRKWDS